MVNYYWFDKAFSEEEIERIERISKKYAKEEAGTKIKIEFTGPDHLAMALVPKSQQMASARPSAAKPDDNH